ncbi:MAG: DUF2779 domain-containing protein [Tenericutes bacterium]|nr:DUF2779 domain-containing protein [Mycoplasmatota bacterium]
MAITKTNFIEYSRCPRYSALEQIRQDKIESKMTLEEYKKEEENNEIKELLTSMFKESGEETEDIDLTVKEDIQLQAMMNYYKEVEIETARLAKKLFKGKFVYSENTYNQESFDFVQNGIRYLCYTDIYNENDDEINIIEVKATTSRKFSDNLKYFEDIKGEKYPLFTKVDGIFKLNNPVNNNEKLIKKYNEKMQKLFDRYGDIGKNIFDLSIQRFIIDNDLKNQNNKKKVNYYLAVLNHKYVYDGYRKDNKRIYNTVDGEDIVVFYDMNKITEMYQDKIKVIASSLEEYIYNQNSNPCNVGVYCLLKETTECKYKNICFKSVPTSNASYQYIGFRDNTGFTENKYNKYDLINSGYYKLDDIPYDWIKDKPNMVIQRDCYDENKIYVDKEKIKAGLKSIEYPIYHLDFESLPCPMPRFRGEKPYSQSCFEFSLHIEHSPGECDFDKDNYVFLADTFNDEREEMVKQLVERIDITKGTMLAQNVSFERTRLKELAELFPEYKKHLLKIVENSTDLLYLIKNNEKLYNELGFDKERSKKINYYHKYLSGSYSIKKTLPVLSNLSYDLLEVKNGTEALVTYLKYETFSQSDLERMKKSLVSYCKQDTWAMVVILDALRKLVN